MCPSGSINSALYCSVLSRDLFDDEHAGGQAREAELRQSILHQNEVDTHQARLPFQGI